MFSLSSLKMTWHTLPYQPLTYPCRVKLDQPVQFISLTKNLGQLACAAHTVTERFVLDNLKLCAAALDLHTSKHHKHVEGSLKLTAARVVARILPRCLVPIRDTEVAGAQVVKVRLYLDTLGGSKALPLMAYHRRPG